MGIMNLLENISTNFIDFSVDKINAIDLNWIGKIIQWLIEGVGIVGLGIILFTLVLKTVTLPLDIYSRVKMKKQSLLMKKMRPQMEKLQKQYENDKGMYSKKVMELQKEYGISMFGACLPMIITMVLFFIVFGAFSTYSQYANLSTYNNMVGEYNSSVKSYILYDLDENTVNEDGFLIEKKDESLDRVVYSIDFDAFEANTGIELTGDTEAQKIKEVRAFISENARRASADYYRENRHNNSDFIWVRNIWYPDSMLNKEIPSFSSFSSSISRATGSGIDSSYEESYNEVTRYLREGDYLAEGASKLEGDRYNGYFVLIILAIGLMFLQQFISMRSQKDANELSTVDGSAKTQNRMMMIMLPLIYGVFSFMYSAAFSIYMITSTVYGLVTMLLINKIMDVSFAKQEANGGYQAKKRQKNRKRLK